ncbi:hypothetical protein JKP88DRAFT_350243 [Tribonema minus]|uniref:Uncharacterized protein n=1 Tax=Tribonema minus TaxID=303371 RepID=A0A836CAX0_9STRA|nr:hypothetical protein JKP88DRAFT_350243 [Tribonema minus]
MVTGTTATHFIASLLRQRLLWPGSALETPWHSSGYREAFFWHLALGSAQGALFWWDLAPLAGAATLILGGAYSAVGGIFRLQDYNLYDQSTAFLDTPQRQSARWPALLRRHVRLSLPEAALCALVPTVRLLLHALRATLALSLAIVGRRGAARADPWAPLALDLLLLLLVFLHLALQKTADFALRILMDEPMQFEVLSNEAAAAARAASRAAAAPGQGAPPPPPPLLPVACELLCDALTLGRAALLEQGELAVTKGGRRSAPTPLRAIPAAGWTEEVARQRRVFEGAARAATEAARSTEAGAVPAVEACGALPLWALVVRRQAFQALAEHVPSPAGAALRFAVYRGACAGVVRAACLAVDLLALQLQALAFRLDAAAAHAVFTGGEPDPPGGLMWLAQRLVLAAATEPPATGDKRGGSSGAAAAMRWWRRRSGGDRGGGAREPVLCRGYVREAVWAARGAAALVAAAAAEAPASAAARLAPSVLHSLAGAALAVRALGRARAGLARARARFAQPRLEAPELEELAAAAQAGIALVAEACGHEMERFAFPPSYAAVIEDCLRVRRAA